MLSLPHHFSSFDLQLFCSATLYVCCQLFCHLYLFGVWLTPLRGALLGRPSPATAPAQMHAHTGFQSHFSRNQGLLINPGWNIMKHLTGTNEGLLDSQQENAFN